MVEKMTSERFDLLVIGGGVNGAGIARDASGRGLKVLLCERDDLGRHTSSSSSKLIHGGLRYLEHYEFRLVRAALKEREALLEAAPHIIWPLRFILPHHPSMRPAWFLRLGLFIYDHLGGRMSLPGTKTVDLRSGEHRGVLTETFKKGFEYSDCWVDDARLVALNAISARELGADIRTLTEVSGLTREEDNWTATLTSKDGSTETVQAKMVVNSAGAWVDDVLNLSNRETPAKNLRLVKGSHIVVDKLYSHDRAYTFQSEDGRVVFTIPYENNYTLIGTTDEDYSPDEGPPEISPEETSYLCRVVSEYFKQSITPADVKWSYSGVRPLFDDQNDNASVVTRDFVFDLDAPDGSPPILSVFGGKITTYRELAEKAVDKLEPYVKVPKPGSWTKGKHLPGGKLSEASFEAFVESTQAKHAWMDPDHLYRLCRSYGTLINDIIKDASSEEDLGQHFGLGLYEAELRYLKSNEYVTSGADVLWRRSKLGLHMSKDQREAVINWFDNASNHQEALSA